MAIHGTPLRYPGGKQKIAPFVAEIITTNSLQGIDYLEPYAGGAGVAVELLLNNLVNKIWLNDSCPSVYAFWKVLVDSPDWLCRKILLASLTVEEWKKHREIFRNRSQHALQDVAFATLYLNRCNRSGILQGGLIGGLSQSGNWKMDARFSRQEIVRRVERIAAFRDRIMVSNLDAEVFMQTYNDGPQAEGFMYCDPPYVKKAERLYLNHYHLDDHERISRSIQSTTKGYWIVSYDASEYIAGLYADRRMFTYDLQYNARNAYIGRELLIFDDKLEIPERSEVSKIDTALLMA